MERISKSQIENDIEGKGNFVKIDYLTRFLKESSSTDIKKFIFLKLAETYENAGMTKESAKNYGNAGMASITFSDKMKYFVKEAETYIKAGDLELAEKAMRKAMSEANSVEKREIYLTVKDFLKKQAELYEKALKRGNAAKIYEKLLQMKVDEGEKKEFMEKLADLYDKLNRRKEYLALKEKLVGKSF